MSKLRKRLPFFIPSILWMAFIFFLSTRSTAGIGHGALERFYIFKSLHLIEYSVLSIFLYFGFRLFRYSIPAAYLYSLTDEFHQTFVKGRTGKFTDTLIDLIGITVGSLLLWSFLKNKYFYRLFKNITRFG
ncbi:MAG TPA: VanZ family protein [Patescibacteria group bacterium]